MVAKGERGMVLPQPARNLHARMEESLFEHSRRGWHRHDQIPRVWSEEYREMLSERRTRESRQMLTRLILHGPNEIAGKALVLPQITYPPRGEGEM